MNIGKKLYKSDNPSFDESRSHVAWTVPDPAGDPSAAGDTHPEMLKIADQYKQAWSEFEVAGPDKIKAWVVRARIDLERTETPSFSRRKNRFLAVTTLALIVGLFGFYPAKIPFVDVNVSKEQWWLVTLSLFVAQVFAFISYCVEQREYLVRLTLAEAEQRASGFYQRFDNRVTAYVRAQEAERRAYYKNLPTYVTAITCSVLLIRLGWPAAHAVWHYVERALLKAIALH